VTESPASSGLIRRGRRVADYLKADCFAVAVVRGEMDSGQKAAIDEHLAFARRLHIETRVLRADDVPSTVVDFARRHNVTQLFVAKPARPRLPFLRSRDTTLRIVELAHDMQVMVVAERRSAAGR
jgi:two-component system, OmpR family, sensor histidine kinase KdpD